jgi:hypothetical protein
LGDRFPFALTSGVADFAAGLVVSLVAFVDLVDLVLVSDEFSVEFLVSAVVAVFFAFALFVRSVLLVVLVVLAAVVAALADRLDRVDDLVADLAGLGLSESALGLFVALALVVSSSVCRFRPG